MSANRIEILGVPVDCVDMKQACEEVENLLKGNKAQAVIAVNPEKVIKAQNDPGFLKRLHSSGLLIPDGIGVVLAARFLYSEKIQRVPGSELMPEICQLAAEKGYKVFLFGASPEVNEKAANELKNRYPGLEIAGRQDGYLDDSEMPGLISRINDSKADILFIALGSPKQELWMDEYLPQLNVKVCQGVGGTFDVIAGHVKRAPMFFLKFNLEWAYRLLSNPRRLLRQTALPKFAFQVFMAKLTGK